jgi:hypothetical protein
VLVSSTLVIFTKSIKELLVRTGVAVSCGLFVAEAIFWICKGHWNLVIAVPFLMLVGAVLLGKKFGYLVTRYIWRAVAVLSLFGGAINPFAYMDFGTAHKSLPYFIAINLLISGSAICLSYCLSEHAKLRKLEGAQRWRSFP